jgi:Methyltransferase domain
MFTACDWFVDRAFEPRRYKPGNKGSWSGHLPFAHDLVVAVRPAAFVELGVHLGESYFGFCQAIAENHIPCLAYAVDTWTGDQHSGYYDEPVYRDVAGYNEVNYSGFSHLIRSRFDDALTTFSDESIDILHIDGLHTFEAVSHDFYAWLPKVRPGGLVLLHDILPRHSDFGVWKLWAGLKEENKTFEFHHNWGLGIFQKPPGNDQNSPKLYQALFDSDEKTRNHIRRYYSLAAVELEWKYTSKNAQNEPLVQVFLPQEAGYTEAYSRSLTVKPDQWQCVVFELPEGIKKGSLRLDLSDRPSLIDLRGVEIDSLVDGTTLWKAGPNNLGDFVAGGTLFPLESPQPNEARRFFSYGNDPQILLPQLDLYRFDQPIILKLWVRIQTDLKALLDTITQDKPPAPSAQREDQREFLAQQTTIEDLREQLGHLKEQLQAEQVVHKHSVELLRSEKDSLAREFERNEEKRKAAQATSDEHFAALQSLLAERDALQKERASLIEERAGLIEEIDRRQTKLYLLEDLPDALNRGENRLADLEENHSKLQNSYAELQQSHKILLDEHARVKAKLDGVLRSHSWKVTAPLRKVSESLRNK